MKLEQIYTGCLAEAAYYIQSNGEAAIIDPLRSPEPYLERAAEDGAKIKYVFLTHFHADFVAGHVDLAKKSGATIVLGPTSMQLGYDAHIGHDGEVFEVGNIKLTMLHTPGHTMESITLLLTDENGKEHCIFTGDTLFIGDVGRPDLAQKVIKDLTQEKLAGHLYDSLRNKIMPLSDDIIVYPNHGAGSACGKNMSSETFDTLGNQKKTNYALRADMTKKEFIEEVLDGLKPPPQYFPKNVLINIEGAKAAYDEIISKGAKALSPREFETTANATDALILDTRDPQVFCKGFIPNSINIGADGSFASWVGTLIPDLDQEILLITDEGKEEDVVMRLSRVGYDNAIGYLKGGIKAWQEAGYELDTIKSIGVDELKTIEAPNILDCRKESEYDSEHVIGAKNVPLDYINKRMSEVDKNTKYYVHCRSGYRSMIFVSMLKARGYQNLIDVAGGFKAIKESGAFNISDYVCPTTML